MVKNSSSLNKILLTSGVLLSLGISSISANEFPNKSLENNLSNSQNLKGVEQYFLTEDLVGCEILNKISYLSSDGKLFNSYSSYLNKNKVENYCKRN